VQDALGLPLAVLAAHRARQDLLRRHRRDGVQDLRFLVAHRAGLERDRRLHGDERQKLEDVVRDHVPQRPGLLVVAAALLDADRLGHGDLHVVDVAPVPDRLEDAVGEPEDHDVLDGLLAQVVIDPVDLALGEIAAQLLIEGAGRFEVLAERFLDDHPAPMPLRFGQKPRRAELVHHRREHGRRRRQVIEMIALGLLRRVHLRQQLTEGGEGRGRGEIARQVMDAAQERVAHRGVGMVRAELVERLAHPVAEDLHGQGLARHADERDLPREKAVLGQVVERGNELAPREIARGAENHDGARIARPLAPVVPRGGVLLHLHRGFPPPVGSTWPPNFMRIAESIFSAKVCDWRERKRA
jgi:hypothetical protein